jgi:hypothetical protein
MKKIYLTSEDKKAARRQSSRKWWMANKEKARKSNRDHYHTHKSDYAERQREKMKDPKERSAHRERNNNRNLELKVNVLSHYSLNHELRCSWKKCLVSDVDMLSLDHIENNGAEDRRHGHAGASLYRKLVKLGFPGGFQTLCLNHQFKKALNRARTLRKGSL